MVGLVEEVTEDGMRWRLWKVEVDGVNSGGSRGGEEVGGGGQRGSMPDFIIKWEWALYCWAWVFICGLDKWLDQGNGLGGFYLVLDLLKVRFGLYLKLAQGPIM